MSDREGGRSEVREARADTPAALSHLSAGIFTPNRSSSMSTHRDAVERSIATGNRALTGAHAALLELVRTLADQVDAAGPEGPSSRLAAAYLSALKDLARALNAERKPQQVGKLAELRRHAGRRSAGRLGA